jgi:hypothetical protein
VGSQSIQRAKRLKQPNQSLLAINCLNYETGDIEIIGYKDGWFDIVDDLYANLAGFIG